MAPHREPRQGTAAGYRRGTRGGVARRAAARGTGAAAGGYAVGLDTRELVRFDTDFSVTISPWEVAEDGAVSD